ncbi:Na+/H+ antiporter NhaA [Paramixta manurensis]|uniref:Na(+)/H(+) antiporter NhaA n=1 Tax=Paramixta manurensis TaxID=2740817 RepID=A0A6M8U528_9GAMM|nr:Na+/H+ antiporter NhaA [Erwiniaceae bacterium PD-1]
MIAQIKRVLGNEATGGVVLILAAALAMLLANTTETKAAYQAFLDAPVAFHFGPLAIDKNVLLWVNDALMALFFLAIGLEVKREMVEGALASREQAVFPLIAALGGMVAPALVFLAFNGHDVVTRNGWAIPSATDIAFALGILALLGSRVPPVLKVFLLTLAVVDDLGAIVIIALFYTHQLSLSALAVAAAAIVVLAVLNRCRVRHTALYLLVGMVLWVAILKSGVHATLAGVIVGFFIPTAQQEGDSPAKRLEHGLVPWVSWFILPLFAFANAGVSLSGISASDIASRLPLGIVLGLLVGKPLGITVFCWLAVKLRIARLPAGCGIKDIAAVGVLCGIGFTMSIFIASLAYGDAHPAFITLAKLGILSGSIISAILGFILLRWRLK